MSFPPSQGPCFDHHSCSFWDEGLAPLPLSVSPTRLGALEGQILHFINHCSSGPSARPSPLAKWMKALQDVVDIGDVFYLQVLLILQVCHQEFTYSLWILFSIILLITAQFITFNQPPFALLWYSADTTVGRPLLSVMGTVSMPFALMSLGQLQHIPR